MAELSLLQQDALTAARLTDALQNAHDVVVCSSWSALERRLGRTDVDVCVVDADHPSREEAMSRLESLQRRHPATALVAFGDFQGQEHTVYRLGRIGIDGVVPAGRHDSGSEVREAVERALLTARARRAADVLKPGSLGRRAVAWSVEHARESPSVDDLAEAMGKTAGVLAARLREEGLPPPQRLLIWGRLLLAGALLARDRRTVEEAAWKVGYAGASALNRAMKREVGRTPGEVARTGGMAAVHAGLFPGGRGGGRGRLRLLTLLLLALVVGGCASTGRAGPSLDERVRTILEAPPLEGSQVGVLAVEAETGRVVVARNAEHRFIPASNQKILTTAAGLGLLGPEHRWRTVLGSSAPLSRGTLEGDLVLVGSGDPTLSSRWWPSAEAALESLADSLRAAGVERVAGDLVVDVAAWDSAAVPGSWEVGDLPWRYAAPGGAFAVAEGELHAVLRGGVRPGDPAELVSWSPRGEEGFLRSHVVSTHPDSSERIRAHHLPETGAVLLRGTVSAGAVDTLRLSAREPVRLAAGLLERTLAARGVAVAGEVRVRWSREGGGGEAATEGCAGPPTDCPGWRPLATLTSPPLTEVARAILEPSQNWIAEQLLWTLGHTATARGSREAGAAALQGWLVEEVGLDSLDAVPEDGSGMSVRNLVTPRGLVAILAYARRQPWSTAWREALASPGEEESTLESRLPELEGRLFAKTGSISNVDALSGYLVRDDGSELIFALLSNASGSSHAEVRRALDSLVRALATSGE